MTKVYGIVGTQRSGSNYVCAALRSISELGDPREYFSPVHIHEPDKRIQAKEDALTFSKDIIKNVPQHKYFGFKIHYLQFHENFLSKGLGIHDVYPDMKIIFLRRTNIIKQAISLWKAELTQSWIADMDEVRKPHYNFGEIRSRYYDLKIHDLMWDKYLKDNKLPFLNVVYEDIEKNEKKFFYNIFSFLGVADKFSEMDKPQLKKQANAQSDEWEARFRKEFHSAPSAQNEAAWVARTQRWDAQCLGSNPGVWREF